MNEGGKIHRLAASPQTVHTGFYDSSIPPVLTIEPGDTVILSSMMLMDGRLRCGMTLDEMLAVRQEYIDRNTGSHTLTGPIFIKGAEPGDVLEVRIQKLVPAECGVNYHFPEGYRRGSLPGDFPAGQMRTLILDLKKMETVFAPGVVIPLRPFFGNMGVAPLPGEKRPHRFGGVVKSRICRIHQTLGDDGIADFIHASALEDIVDLALQKIADAPLAVSAANIKGQRVHFGAGGFHPSQDVAHLGPIAVGDNHLVSGRYQIDQVFRSSMTIFYLVRNITFFFLA